jgi:DNA-binding NtrC family response regulator
MSKEAPSASEYSEQAELSGDAPGELAVDLSDLGLQGIISALSRMSPSHPDVAKILAIVERLQDRPYRSHGLIIGEPGTGKEGLARLLHQLMHPQGGPHVVFRCVSSARAHRSLLEEFGASPSASGEIVARLSECWTRAYGGSLVIEELLALPPAAQDALYDHLGRQKWSDADAVAVIALSDGDLALSASQGGLRHDLFYKLGRIVFSVPPLRERPADLQQSALWICNRVLRGQSLAPWNGRRAELKSAAPAEGGDEEGAFLVEPAALAALLTHPTGWPGNFRELEAVIERAILLYSDGETLREADVLRSLADVPRTAGPQTKKP